MRRRNFVALIGTMLTGLSITLTARPAFADCKDEIEDVEKDLKDNRDKYTAEAVAEARKSLGQARRVTDRAVECRREVGEARKALAKGKK